MLQTTHLGGEDVLKYTYFVIHNMWVFLQRKRTDTRCITQRTSPNQSAPIKTHPTFSRCHWSVAVPTKVSRVNYCHGNVYVWKLKQQHYSPDANLLGAPQES